MHSVTKNIFENSQNSLACKQRVWVLLWCIGLVIFGGCSSQATQTPATPGATTDEEDLDTFLAWSGAAWKSLNETAEADKSLTFPLDCPGGGTMDQEGSQIILTDCVVQSDTVTYEGSGTYSLTEEGTLVMHAWDQNLTVVDTSQTFSSSGYINFETSDDSVVYNFSATFSGGVHRMAGSISDNLNNTSDATLALSLDGTVWLDCTFNDVDLNALTTEDIDTACSDSGTETTDSCATATCSNDFECQLYADSDTDDDFTTANTQCMEGCCGIPESIMEEFSCADNTVSCSSDFECQSFAVDDQTDEFETDNVECSGGCCALISP